MFHNPYWHSYKKEQTNRGKSNKTRARLLHGIGAFSRETDKGDGAGFRITRAQFFSYSEPPAPTRLLFSTLRQLRIVPSDFEGPSFGAHQK